MKKYYLLLALLLFSFSINAQMHNGHAYVDLGLSVKWATCNVGANNPYDKGDYFSWGDTNVYKDENTNSKWIFYKWCNMFVTALTKYNNNKYYGKIDGKKKLDIEDDMANFNWGGNWRLPTDAELEELEAKCIWKWVEKDGVSGQLITSKINGNSIFLPASGSCLDSPNDTYLSPSGFYWSSTLDIDRPYSAWIVAFTNNGMCMSSEDRCLGLSVRAVF